MAMEKGVSYLGFQNVSGRFYLKIKLFELNFM